MTLSTSLPALTGRPVWIGHSVWTSGFEVRAGMAARLFDGVSSPDVARRLIANAGTRFVLSPCGSSSRIEARLAPVAEEVRRFGCARVYRVR